MNACRHIVIATAFVIAIASDGSSVRAEEAAALCPAGDAACARFVGISPHVTARAAPRPGGTRYGYLIGGHTVVLNDFQAWRLMRCLAYVTWAEGRNQGVAGMTAIAWVVANRAAMREVPDWCAVASEPGQFESMSREESSAWLDAARGGTMPPDITSESAPDRKAAQVAKALAWRFLTGTVRSDPTRGATHFIATAVQKRLGRPLPAWVKRFQLTHVKGDHKFYRQGSGVYFASLH